MAKIPVRLVSASDFAGVSGGVANRGLCRFGEIAVVGSDVAAANVTAGVVPMSHDDYAALAWEAAGSKPDLWYRTEGSYAPQVTGSGVSNWPNAGTLGSAGDLLQGTDGNRPIGRKNLLTYSEVFDNAAWTSATTNVGVTANAAVAPDGTTTADKLFSTAGTSQHRMSFDAQSTFTAATYTLSVRAKAAEWGYIGLTFYDGSAYKGAIFSLTDGSASFVQSGTTTTATSLGSGWWLLSISTTTAGTLSAASAVSGFWPRQALPAINIQQSSDGDGSSGVYIWGAQLELGSLSQYQRVAAADSYDTSVVSPVYFDGVDNYLKTVAIASLVQPTTVYMVVNQVSWTNGDYFFDGNAAGSVYVRQDTTTPEIEAYAGTASTNDANLAVGTYGVVCVVFNGANSVLQVNNNTAVTGNFGAGNLGGLTLGANATPGNYGNIAVREAAVFSAAHDATKRATVIAYLRAKHGI